jgi:hypothetical protein
MSEGKTTTDHDEIRSWAEERGGVPASVKGTGKTSKSKSGEAGILRLDFEPRDEELEEISWEEFFEKFDKEKLAFLYQEETGDGSTSRFHKFIARTSAAKGSSGKSAAGKSGSGKSGSSNSAGSGKSTAGAKSKGGGKKSSSGKS